MRGDKKEDKRGDKKGDKKGDKRRDKRRDKKEDKRWNRLERGREGDVWRFSLFRIIEFLFFLGFVLKMLHFVAERKIFCTFVLRTAVITYFSFPKILKSNL